MRTEKDQYMRLSSKTDDLKQQLYQQQALIDEDEGINTMLQPLRHKQDHLRSERSALRRQILILQGTNRDLVSIIKETLLSTLGGVSIEVQDRRTSNIVVDIAR